jgi:ATP-dependent Lon protease
MSSETKPSHSYMTRSKNSSTQKGKDKLKDKKNEKLKDKRKQYKYNESSDSDDSEWTSGEDIDEEFDEEFDLQEYRKFIAKVFPSKYASERANGKETEKTTVKKSSDKKSIKDESDKKNTENDASGKKASSKSKKFIKHSFNKLKKNKIVKSNKKQKEDEKTESEEDEDTLRSVLRGKRSVPAEEEEETEDDEEEESEREMERGKPSNFNIIFTIGSERDDDYYDEDDEEYDEEYDDEDEDEEEDEDEDEEEDEEEDEKEAEKAEKEVNTNELTKEADLLAIEKLRTTIDDIKKMDGSSKLMKQLTEQLETAEKAYENGKNKQIKKTKTKNTKKFISLLRDKNMMNDVRFFKEKMSLDEQEKIIKQMEIIKKHCQIEKPYKLTLLEADIPPEFKAVAYKKINTLKYMEPGGGEYYKIKQWIDTFMQIPFGRYKNLPVTLQQDGAERCSEFMDYAKKTLDSAVYGMNDVKLQVMQLVGQWITNPKAVGTAVAIKGPMGTGKTTLVKEGISKILGRDFAFIALGGATDSSFLEGHSYTYEGSMWGKIIDILVQCKSMNPVIFLDELDKVSDTPKGEEIIGILTHLTDTSQNSKFHDKYFAELDFDLSRALFIFSYNDESKINPILRDRMYRVQTKGYDMKEKTVIANNYLLPKIREQVCFNKDDIIIPDETMGYIINNHTENEDGVRNLKRCLEIIYTKLNLYRLMKPGTNLFESEMSLRVSFPMTITNEIVDKLIKNNKEMGVWHNMYL